MPDYKNGKIYKIVDNTSDMVYIGSTCQTLAQRLAKHRSSYASWLRDKKTENGLSSFKIIANGDYDIILIEYYPCESKEELHSRERYWIESFECVNKIRPTRTRKEYYEENREAIKAYNITHKDDIAEKKNIYNITHKDDIAEKKNIYYITHKDEIAEKRKIYYITHKDEIAEKKKIYRNKNKENIFKVCNCLCGST